jgi:hypothetical protein
MTKLTEAEIDALALQLDMEWGETEEECDAALHRVIGHLDKEDQQIVFLRLVIRDRSKWRQ